MYTPKQAVQKRFGSKEELAKRVATAFGDLGVALEQEEKDRLVSVANGHLLRLIDVLLQIKQTFRNKSDLVDAVLKLKHRGTKPDVDYRTKLESFSVKRLWDMYHALGKRAKQAS